MGGGGVLAGGAAVDDWPPCGEGNWDVDAISPTATHVEQDLDVWSNLAFSNKKPDLCNEFKANSETALLKPGKFGVSSGDGNWLISLVLKLFCRPTAEDKAAQLRIKSVSSSNHKISGISAGLQCSQILNNAKKRRFEYYAYLVPGWPRLSGFGLCPLTNWLSLLLKLSNLLPGWMSEATDDTENSDKSVVTDSCEGERKILQATVKTGVWGVNWLSTLSVDAIL